MLLKQRQTKSNPPYEPHPYRVTDIQGHQITADRDDKQVTRDAQKWKLINPRVKPDYSAENAYHDVSQETDVWWPSDDICSNSNARSEEQAKGAQNADTPEQQSIHDQHTGVQQNAQKKSKMSTRSQGKSLEWSRVMNAPEAVIEI